MITILAAFSACAAGAAAQTACPTGADVDRGVRFHLATGETEVFRRLDSGIIESHFAYDGENSLRLLLAKGIYLLEVVEFNNEAAVSGSRVTYGFPLAPAEMPEPTAGGGWTVTVARLERGSLDSETQSYSFGNPTTQTYGACTYSMLPIEISYPLDTDSKRLDVLHYLPDLGLSYLAGFSDSESTVTNTYTAIEALP